MSKKTFNKTFKKAFKKRIILTKCAFISALTLLASTCLALPQHSPVPGGLAIVEIPSTTESALYKNSAVMILEEKGKHFAVIGISLKTGAGSHSFTITDPNRKQSEIFFEVQDKQYKEQRLTIKNKRKVNPYAEDMDRIIQNRDEMNKAFTQFNRDIKTQSDFSLPVEGPISSPFGLKRFLNEQARSPHSGLDIAAASGVNIKASAAGKVVAVGDYFFNGNTVLVDHGQGLISMYCHMSKVNVALGQDLKSGESVGEVGMTGRVTGPHLHWSVSLNNTRVNPNLFLNKSP